MSSFFLTHGYDLEVIDLWNASYKLIIYYKEREIAKNIVEKLV
jgi:hypothetical protein